ncbi:ATP-dependent nuclease [Staphylococcus agnetis]|uniref:ATP-dependent nuclease n=1 Tax=Staphylococcus agnetis TaxID=985762 RepID=UPI000D0302E2|nr:AAA family ATPase [Staphylococcus agnetis]
MKINNVYIKNFRSIVEANITLTNYNVVFGKNNEGKSNILKAINRGWDIVNDFSNYPPKYLDIMQKRRINHRFKYKISTKWSREIEEDIPIDLRNKNNSVTIRFGFSLSEDEQVELSKLLKTKTKITDLIYIEVKYDESLFYLCKVKLNMNGKFLTSNHNIHISTKYILENFHIDFIPSIRTEDTATEIIQSAVRERLKDLKLNEEYNKAINLINDLQNQELKKLSSQIEPDMKKYLKNIKSVEIVNLRNDVPIVGYGYSKGIDIQIDDGRLTSIKNKGDGIKSLIALSILQTSESSNRLLMIDEPEAHLHSGSIRELKNKIKNDTTNHQVLICSHHQIFVDKYVLSNNKILNEGRIKENNKIPKIREQLGVAVDENLINSEIVVLVEGETDKSIIEEIMKIYNPKLKSLVNDGRIHIAPINGTRNLNNVISIYEIALCKIICLLDNDEATKNINLNNSSNLSKVLFIPKKNNKKEVEIEDVLTDEFIFKVVDEFFQIENSIDRRRLIGKQKFTNGLVNIVENYGIKFNKYDENELKQLIVNRLKNTSELPIREEYVDFFNIFFSTLEKLIDK